MKAAYILSSFLASLALARPPISQYSREDLSKRQIQCKPNPRFVAEQYARYAGCLKASISCDRDPRYFGQCCEWGCWKEGRVDDYGEFRSEQCGTRQIETPLRKVDAHSL